MAFPKKKSESESRSETDEQDSNYNNYAMDLMDKDSDEDSAAGAPGDVDQPMKDSAGTPPESAGGVSMTKTSAGFSLTLPGKSYDEARAAAMDFFGLGDQDQDQTSDLDAGAGPSPLDAMSSRSEP